jgi:O-antigen ligase
VGAAAAVILLASPPASLKRRITDETAINLTGRPAIWRAGWYLVEERPLEGFGYDAETKVLQDPAYQRTARVRFSVAARQSMHNGYLSILAGTGVIGLAMWLALLALPFTIVWRIEAGGRKALAIGIMSMGLLTNLVESQITPASSLTAAVFWIAWAVAGRLAAGVRPGPASPLRKGTGTGTSGEVAT